LGKIIKEIIEFMEKDPNGCRIEFILLNKSKENGNRKYSSCRFKSKPTTRLFIENYLEFLGNGKYTEKEESPLRGDNVFEDSISYENKDNIKELPLILTEPTNKTIKFETLKKEHKIQSLLVTFFNSDK
jgi:hypothetical protein